MRVILLSSIGKRALFIVLALLLLAGLGLGPSLRTALDRAALALPDVASAQDSYPIPPMPPTHDPYAGPPPPLFPTHDPYAGPPEPTTPPEPTVPPEPTPPPDKTATPTLRPTQTFTPMPDVTETAPPYPITTPTVATPEAPTPVTPTPIGAVTATPSPATPVEAPETEGEYPAPTAIPAARTTSTPDRAAMLISTAVAREQASAANMPVDTEASRSYGGFVAVAVVLLVGIGYAMLLRRQRERDRQELWRDKPPEE